MGFLILHHTCGICMRSWGYTSIFQVCNFISHYFFKKSLLNSFTILSTVPMALSQQKQPILLCPSVCLTWWQKCCQSNQCPWFGGCHGHYFLLCSGHADAVSTCRELCPDCKTQDRTGGVRWWSLSEWEMGVFPSWSLILGISVLCWAPLQNPESTQPIQPAGDNQKQWELEFLCFCGYGQ